MIPDTATSGPSYPEWIVAGSQLAPPISTETEHQVPEAHPQIATKWTDQTALLARVLRSPIWSTDDLSSQIGNVAMPETIIPAFLAKIPRSPIRPAEDVDLQRWFISSSQIGNVAMPETIIPAYLAKVLRPPIPSINDLISQISNAVMPEAIITALRRCGLDAVSERLSYLYELVEDDPDEPSINLDSLRKLALFLLNERQLGNPQIGVNPDGLALAEWPVGEKGVLAMEFLPSGFIRFAAISAPAKRGVECKRVSGTLSKSETMNAIRPFTDRLASP